MVSRVNDVDDAYNDENSGDDNDADDDDDNVNETFLVWYYYQIRV